MRIDGRHLAAALFLALVIAVESSCHSDSSSPVAVASVDVTPAVGTVNVGSSFALTAHAMDAGGTVITGRPIVFVSSDTNIATVASSGIVTGVAPGAVTVTATVDTKSAPAQITVLAVRDDWTTYGHDVRRTSASLGSVTGPLSVAWSYTPQGTAGHDLVTVLNAIGTADGLFVRTSLASHYGYGTSSAIERVSPAGAHVWTFNMGTDADFGDWASLMANRIIVNSDGTRYVDQGSGLSVHSNGVDTWGEILSDSSTLYYANDVQIDGPGVFAAAYDSAFKARWTANKFQSCRGSAAATAGGLALSNGTLFYAPAYNVGKPATVLPFASGVFAFNASTGAQTAYHASTPFSRISADDSRVYLIENQSTLVALAQSDLHVLWSAPITGPGEQSPVLANGLVIVGTASGVVAYDASSGVKSWSSATLNGAAAHWYSTYQGGNCGSVQIPVAYGATATIAAALGSRTLVVTASDGVHVLALATGADLWHAQIAGISGVAGNPVIVNEPNRGATVYVETTSKVYALTPPAALAIVGTARAQRGPYAIAP